MKRYASDRDHQLAGAITAMASRYGNSMHCAGLAFNSSSGCHGGKSWEAWDSAGRRQFRALQRLTRWLRDAEVQR